MRASIFSIDNTSIPLSDVSLTTRVGCMLADRVCITETLSYPIGPKNFAGYLSINQKIKLLKQAYGNNPDNAAVIELLDNFKITLTKFQNVKYKSTHLIVSYKMAERHINKMYADYEAYLNNTMEKTDLPELMPLVNEGIIEVYKSEQIATEDEPAGIEKYESIRELLNDMTDVEKDAAIFIMPAAFISDECRSQPRYFDADEPEALDPGMGYLQLCFTMPDLNFFKGVELMSLRKALQEPGRDFRTKMDKWLQLCSETEDASLRLNFFMQQVLPAAKAMEKPIKENRLFQYTAIAGNSQLQETNVFIGEVPLLHMRNFFRHYEAGDDNAWIELRDAPDDDPRLSKRWPLMFADTTFTDEAFDKFGSIAAEENQPGLSTKKSIDID